MSYVFKIWDQARDGSTMALRVAQLGELKHLARAGVGSDIAGNWASLAEYLAFSETAGSEPIPFVREVDVLWEHGGVIVPSAYIQDRKFRVTYTGRVLRRGGFSSQGYCVMDPAWEPALRPHDKLPVRVDYHIGSVRDLIVVRA